MGMGKGVMRMKLNELIAKYGEYEVNEEELMKSLKEPVKPGRWKPKNGETYYFIRPYGAIGSFRYSEDSSDSDWLSIGNCFQTMQDAERAVEYLKIRAELLDAGGIERTGWDNHSDYCYTIRCLGGRVANTLGIPCTANVMAFKSKYDADNAINKVGEERLLKYWFRIENEDEK